MSSTVHAGFEGFVWVVIVVIAIVSELVKNARRMGPSSRKPDDGTWGQPPAPDTRSLDKRIEDYLKQLSPPPTEGLPRQEARAQPPPIPPRLVARRAPPAPPRRPPPAPARPRAAVPQRIAAGTAPLAVRPPAPVRVAAPAPASRPMAPSPDMPAEALRRALRTDLSEGASLRQVVLLAEIIGPPRALRPLHKP
jgi:hypothetical protein